MADDFTTSFGTFRGYNDGTREHPAGIAEYITGGSPGAWTVQYVDLTHGLPVQPQTGATFPVSAASLPLPTGAALDATLTGGTLVAKAVGDVASGSADSGAPAKVGGQANSSAPTAVTAGQRVNSWWGLNGQLVVSPGAQSIGDTAVVRAWQDPVGSFAVGAAVGTLGLNPGAGTWDRWRNNGEATVLASAARTASVNSADQTNYNARGVAVVIDITAGGGAGSLTVKLTGKDTLSGKYVTLFSTGALSAPGTSTYSFQVFPGSPTVAQVSATPATVGMANFLVPRVWRIEITAADATSYTFSVGANYLV